MVLMREVGYGPGIGGTIEMECPVCGHADSRPWGEVVPCPVCATPTPELRQRKWDLRFLELAKFVSSWSKDPSTKCGAVIVDEDRRVVSIGYNGFATGVEDLPDRYSDREQKYRMVCHAEVNAIVFACRPLKRCTLYTWPFAPCSNCAAIVIQSGVIRCVAPPLPAELQGRWADSISLTVRQLVEAGMRMDILDVS